MGARQSKRSVDITTTPKKDGLPADGSVAGDAAAPGDGKLERIEETDGKPITNGTAPHTDSVTDEKDKDKEQEKEKEKEKENEKEKEKEKDKDEDNEKEDVKVEDTRPESNTDAPAEAEEVTTPTDGATPTSPDSATSPDSKDAKKKDKKKKWSFRSLSFGKRDRSKTAREDTPKNGDVTKEEPLAEGGEEAEAAVPVEESPAEDKTAVSSPTTESTPAPAVVKEEEKAAPVSPNPVEEKKEEPTPAPTPVVLVQENIVEIEKVETVVVTEKVEVSPAQAVSPVGVTQAQPIATPSIIERKTSEEIPPPLPSSPPPTPIDPSPLQQAQHTAANASALAEALKVPAEAASIASQIVAQSVDESKDKLVTEPKVVLETKLNESESVSTDVKNLEETANQIVTEVVEAVESLPELTPESPIVSEESIEKPIVCEEIVLKGMSASDAIIQMEKFESAIVESDRKGDLVIQSEEGPLPLSEESLVEAKPAVVVTEDDFADSVIKAVEKIDLDGLTVDEESKAVDVVLEADKVQATESNSNTELLEKEKVEIGETEPTYAEVLSARAKQTQSEPLIPTKSEAAEVIPPLPASPIPSFDSDLTINKELESEAEFDPIEKLRACHMATDGLVNSAKDTLQDISGTLTEILHFTSDSPIVEKIDDALPEFPACTLSEKDTSNLIDDLPVPPNEIHTTNEEDMVCPLPAKDLINPAKDLSDPETCPISKPVIENGNHVEEESPIEPLSKKIFNEQPISPPRDASPSISPKESSQLIIINDQSNEEFGVESLSQSLNSYNDSDVQLKERLAESEGLMNGVENSTSCPLLKAVPSLAVPDNAQKIAEPEAAPAENPAEISTTESENEAPASPAPPVPVEIPVLPPSEPAITEDVASVTKAIEETDISDKAVAAAVNEAIESVNANEIVNDSHHQNVINE